MMDSLETIPWVSTLFDLKSRKRLVIRTLSPPSSLFSGAESTVPQRIGAGERTGMLNPYPASWFFPSKLGHENETHRIWQVVSSHLCLRGEAFLIPRGGHRLRGQVMCPECAATMLCELSRCCLAVLTDVEELFRMMWRLKLGSFGHSSFALYRYTQKNDTFKTESCFEYLYSAFRKDVP